MIKCRETWFRPDVIVLTLIITAVTGGCRLMVNPFTDELSANRAVTTPSMEGVFAADVTPVYRQRPYEPVENLPEDGTVTHGPLYFEDSFADRGDEDGRFAWTGEDYRQLFYWRGRFLLNAAWFPVSVLVTPPWVVMASDGRVSRQAWGCAQDAEPWIVDSPAGRPDTVTAVSSQ